MIAHVAAAGEARGRVVLRVCGAGPSAVALAAAVHVARAYQSQLESVFIRDEHVLAMASHPFTKVISPSGRSVKHWRPADIDREYRAIERKVAQHLSQLATPYDVPLHSRVVSDDPLRALTAACAEAGPWNVIALAEPVGGYAFDQLAAILSNVRDATGLVLAGRNAVRTEGPVVIVVDDVASISGAIRAGSRLAETAGQPLLVLPAGADDPETDTLEGHLRLALADASEDTSAEIVVTGALHGSPDAMAEVVRRLRPGFVIARLGGALIPDPDALRSVIGALEGPLFLVR
ncbi:MAG: hypothetical protein AAGC70_19995 [Pseudomonadota bacterium]